MGERETVMPGCAPLRWAFRLTFYLCLLPLCGLAGAQAKSPEDLAKLEARIERGKEDLDKLRSQESSVLVVLERIDRDLDKRNTELKQLRNLTRSHARKVETTERAVKQVATRLQAGRKAFLARARALYKWQRGGSPFVLLTGDVSALELMRRKRHLEIVLNHDRELIDGLSRRAVELARLEGELKMQRAVLNDKRNEVVAVRASVRRERERKKTALYSVQREKRLRARVLNELERASAKLQELINDSKKVAAKSAPVASATAGTTVRTPVVIPVTGKQVSKPWEGFENGKGKLELPVRGTIIGGFGRRRHPDLNVEVQRQGLDIAAPEGEEIRAVERGEVIFSNRLSGYGRMVILDHGERYYTVYAHLSQLHKSVGDRVRRGEPIAAVGDSGPSGRPRLYFEVRKDGRPIDPAPWFKDGAPRDPTARSVRNHSKKTPR
jgi:septal ring factor EnvC (AmiA/AmiB activator)